MCRDAYRMVTAKTEETIERYKAAEKKDAPKVSPANESSPLGANCRGYSHRR